MNRCFWIAGLFLSSCGFTGKGEETSGTEIDANVTKMDARIDSPPGSTCMTWTPLETVDPCAADLGAPADLAVTADATFNSVTGMISGRATPLPGKVIDRSAMNLPSLRVVNLSSLQVNNMRTLTLVGDHAVLFLVHGDVAISGTINASAAAPVDPPVKAPGADSARCEAARRGGTGTASDVGTNAGGGGGGGGFGAAGGSGGAGEGARAGGAAGALDGENLPLRGGCAGGRGGDNENNGTNQGGLGGGGGGAFAISARGTFTANGTSRLMVNGAAGRQGVQDRAGGGGGGAGGTLMIDATAVTVAANAQLCAKGGGGGEGSSEAADGDAGTTPSCSTTAASGGSGNSMTSGNGGPGGTFNAAAGGNGADGVVVMGVHGGGGGGGGAAGKILLRARDSGTITVSGMADVSPAHASI